jgi:hypothetical protein
VAVLEKAKETADANLKLIENYFKQGMLQNGFFISVQGSRTNRNQLQYAKKQCAKR